MITNGARETTQGYVDQAGLGAYVDAVQSCDQVGKSKPFADVYTTALELCDKVERKAQSLGGMKGKDESERWFVAAHMWDLHAARTHGSVGPPPLASLASDQGVVIVRRV